MSDFDKEAEREKLREKFEQEEDNRAATEQMSELLLKGATMTNAHCSECGDPIFRYDGQEFCPTCQKPVARDAQADGAETDDGDEETADSTGDGDNIEMAAPSDEARVQFGDDSNEPDQTAAEAGAADGQTTPDAAPSAPQEPSQSDSSTNASHSPPEAGGDRTTQPRSQPDSPAQNARTGAPNPADRTTESERQPGNSSQDPPLPLDSPRHPKVGPVTLRQISMRRLRSWPRQFTASPSAPRRPRTHARLASICRQREKRRKRWTRRGSERSYGS